MHPMLNIAIRAARNAGGLIQRSSENVSQLSISKKSKDDVVTEVVRVVEQEITHVIKYAYPDHGIITEENGEQKGNEYTWVVDPISGITNFSHGYPQYAVSIALKNKGKTEVGVIYDPLKDELFTAEKGGGAMLNNRRIRVTKQADLSSALLGTGSPFKQPQHLNAYMGMLKSLTPETTGIRQTGSTALDLAHLSVGQLDGFWGIGLKEWNFAAGILLIQEAGGVVTDFSFNDKYVKSGNIITGNPKMHQAMYQLIEPHVTALLK